MHDDDEQVHKTLIEATYPSQRTRGNMATHECFHNVCPRVHSSSLAANVADGGDNNDATKQDQLHCDNTTLFIPW